MKFLKVLHGEPKCLQKTPSSSEYKNFKLGQDDPRELINFK